MVSIIQGGEKSEEATSPSTPEGRVAVVIIPSLSIHHLRYLNTHTHFYKVCVCTLPLVLQKKMSSTLFKLGFSGLRRPGEILNHSRNNTNLALVLVLQIVATHLWNYLADDTSSFHHRSVELMHLLHQLAPTPWVVEDVVGSGLLSDDKV